MTNHMIKTTKEWQSTSMLNKIIERGILCIEITTNDAFFAKVGDGRRSYKNLPYLFQSSFDQLTNVDMSLMELIQNGLDERYTKEEIDAIENELRDLIQNIDLSNYVTNEVLHEYTQSFTPEEKEKLASLENADLSGLDARVTVLEEIDHSLYATEEYVDEKIENLDINVDLSDYATITYVDEKIAAIDIPSIDLSMYATKSWVSTQIANIPGMDLTGYATEQYVDDAIAAIPEYVLPIATDSTLGGVKIGEGVNISQDGTISVDQSIIPDVPEELGVMDLQVKQDEVGVLTSTKPNNVTEDLDVLQYLGVLTLNVGFAKYYHNPTKVTLVTLDENYQETDETQEWDNFSTYQNYIDILTILRSTTDTNFYKLIIGNDVVGGLYGRTFVGCQRLYSVEFGTCVSALPNNCFESCSNLTELDLHISSFGTTTFYGCSSLTSFLIPNGMTTIPGSSFNNCISLVHVEVPDTVTSIYQYAFNRCYALTEITIPSSVTGIDSRAFGYCSNLTSIIIEKASGSISGAPWGATNATITWTG